MNNENLELVSLKTFLDFIESDETDMFFLCYCYNIQKCLMNC